MNAIAWLAANRLRALSGVLIVAALAVTLCNTSEFAAWYEPTRALAWAWACYVDMAICGYTLAQAHGRGDRTVRFAFWWFIGLSLVANIAVTLARYDAQRLGGGVIASVVNSVWFMGVTCALYGASIPISVYTFAHTLARAESNGVAHVASAGDARARVREAWRALGASASAGDVARRAGVSVTTARKWRGR